MSQANLLFIDIETTGFSPRKHEIIELAAAIEINGVTQCEFTLYFRPEKWENISKEALAKNGWTVEWLKRLPERWGGARLFRMILDEIIPKTGKDRFTIVEHSKNGNFDINFLKQLSKQWAKSPIYEPIPFRFYFHSKPINARDLVKKRFPKEKNLTLKDCARLLGIPFDDSRHHGALYDMQVMKKIYHKCKGGQNA